MEDDFVLTDEMKKQLRTKKVMVNGFTFSLHKFYEHNTARYRCTKKCKVAFSASFEHLTLILQDQPIKVQLNKPHTCVQLVAEEVNVLNFSKEENKAKAIDYIELNR